MHYLTSIEDKMYLLWQLEVQIKNFEELGELSKFIGVILLHGATVSDYAKELKDRYPQNIYLYESKMNVKGYVAANKPYGLALHLKEHPEHGKRLLLLDSDIIFREKLDFSLLEKDNHHYLADTVSYIGYKYLSENITDSQIKTLCEIVGVDFHVIKERQDYSGGGTYYLKNINHIMCMKITYDSILLYHKLKEFEAGGSKVQVWTAEMWAWLWNLFLIGETRLHSELDFSWATDPLSKVEKFKTLHLAGVVDREQGLFYKGMYLNRRPWEDEDFSYVTKRDSGSQYYLDYILKHFK